MTEATFLFQDKFESNTTYYGSDGTDSYKSSSCLQSDESHEPYEVSSSSTERKMASTSGVIQQYTGTEQYSTVQYKED